MDVPRARERLLYVGVVLAIAALVGPPSAAADYGSIRAAAPRTDPALTSTIDPSGLEIVKEISQARPASEVQAQSLSDAFDVAEASPDDVGYPWIDPSTGTLELSAASAKGLAILGQKRANLATTTLIRQVAISYGKLESIKHEITTLNVSGVPDADLIYQTTPDHLSNRIIVSVNAPSEVLFEYLAQRYGSRAIAVLIDPQGPASSASRQDDSSRFWGGAKILAPGGYCTDSFAWTVSTTGDSLLTAAHCAPSGGSVSISGASMGAVTASSGENWSTSTGTTYYSGQSIYRGDVALIRITSPLTSQGYIYRGDATSNSGSPVKSMLSRYSAVGDAFYAGGMKTGETWPWHVNYVGVDRWYSADGPNVWARNVTDATKGSTCIDHGDSGGSIFLVTTGGVQAAGTISGIGPVPCTMFFTDIYRSFLGLPGTILTN